MPSITSTPRAIMPYTISHGMDLTEASGGQYEGECPDSKCGGLFRVDEREGLWTCLKCHRKGNTVEFLRWVYDLGGFTQRGMGQVSDESPEAFAKTRSLLSSDALDTWGIRQSPITREWLVPGFTIKQEKGSLSYVLMNLYIYRNPPKKSKKTLIATANCEHQLLGLPFYSRKKANVILCESIWDAMVLWEVLQHTRETNKGIQYTDNPKYAVINTTSILAVPGCRVWKESWCDLFKGKRVTLLFHSDHPKQNSMGVPLSPEGHEGMKRVIEMLHTHEEKPESIHFLNWGDEGYDPDLKSGFDVRDWLTDTNLPSGMTEPDMEE